MADETTQVVNTGEQVKVDASTSISSLKLSEELSLTDDFDLTSALHGNLVGYTDTDGTLHTGTLRKSVTCEEFAQYGAVYFVKDGDKEILFDRQGNCVSPEYTEVEEDKKPKLKNVTATLPTFDNNKVQTRSGGETATINAIRPIDQFAIAIIQPILQRLPNPQEMSAADILKWSDVAYKWAQGMFSIASTYRTANDSEVSTNSDSVKTAIDNVVKGLNALTTEVKTKEVTQFPDVVKVDNPDDDKFQVEGVSTLTLADVTNAIDEKIKAFAELNSLKTS